MPPQDPQTRSYPLNPRILYPLYLAHGLTILVAMALAILGLANHHPSKVVLGSFAALISLGHCYLANGARLYITPSGVKLRLARLHRVGGKRRLWLMLETPWSNIESLRMDRSQEAFITKTPMDSVATQCLAATARPPTYDSTALRWMSAGRYIPLASFSAHLRRGLGEDLRRFAPHLQAALAAGV